LRHGIGFQVGEGMSELDVTVIAAQAQAELYDELFREAVEKYKAKLRAKKSVWDRIFPWRIVFVRKPNV
jgi:hypothetical protein